MKGIKVTHVGGDYQVVDDLEKPTPGPNQVLVKPIYGAVNPVDEMMRNSGLLIASWPWTPCGDIAGIVVELGSNVTKLKVGDRIAGCPGVGLAGAGGAAEYLVVHEELAIKVPDNIPFAAAASAGAGLMTAALGIWNGLNVAIPDPENLPPVSDEWILVLGGGGSVGGFATQVAKLSGYKVISTVSSRTVGVATSYGADETVDYKAPVDEQVSKILSVTQGHLHRVFDATSYSIDFVKEAFKAIEGQPGENFFTSTDDWTDFGTIPAAPKFYPISLGPIARPEAVQLNADAAKFIKVFEALLTSGKLKPAEYVIIGETGFESWIEGINAANSGTVGGKKIVLKFQDE
ncbi:Zeta-crystallin [Dactylella cylindrospora]|nr:Zeta-crystallin [Dactylella cylindrospora]